MSPKGHAGSKPRATFAGTHSLPQRRLAPRSGDRNPHPWHLAGIRVLGGAESQVSSSSGTPTRVLEAHLEGEALTTLRTGGRQGSRGSREAANALLGELPEVHRVRSQGSQNGDKNYHSQGEPGGGVA